MKQAFIICGICLLAAFKTADDPKANLQFTKTQYEAVKNNFWLSIYKIDSVKIALQLQGSNDKLIKLLGDAEKAISENGNFIGQIDSVFTKK